VENDAQDLLALSDEKRKHAMKALATLSEYVGYCNQWKDIRERYQLKWSIGDSLQAFNDIFNSEKNLLFMLHWLKDDTVIPHYRNPIVISWFTIP
jgi:isopenicillin N synthase-like dioxygenase